MNKQSQKKSVLSILTFVLFSGMVTAQQSTRVERILVGNEGGFGASNATISVISPETDESSDGVFLSANGLGLGDVLQSMNRVNNQIYAVMNNSSSIVIMNAESYLQEGLIDLGAGASPRRMVMIDEATAYVSDLYANALHVIDLGTGQAIDSKIMVGNGPEYLLKVGQEVLVSNFGFGQDSTVMVINSVTHQVTDTLVLASGPAEMILDTDGSVWVICSGYAGDYDENWNLIQGTQRPGGIFRLNKQDESEDWLLEKHHELETASTQLGYSSTRKELYLQSNGVRSFDLRDLTLKEEAMLEGSFYSMYYEPVLDYLFLADAKDYVSAGTVSTWSLDEQKVMQEYTVGIIPSSFLALYEESATVSYGERTWPREFVLGQNYPNPFNPSTRIPIELFTSGHLRVNIINSLGQKVSSLIDQSYPAGRHLIEFNASNLPSGVYFVQAFFNEQQHFSKIILLK